MAITTVEGRSLRDVLHRKFDVIYVVGRSGFTPRRVHAADPAHRSHPAETLLVEVENCTVDVCMLILSAFTRPERASCLSDDLPGHVQRCTARACLRAALAGGARP